EHRDAVQNGLARAGLGGGVPKGARGPRLARFLLLTTLQPLLSASTKRGKTGTGAGKVAPALIRFCGPSASTLRSSGLIASRSSNFDAGVGTNGCARMAT